MLKELISSQTCAKCRFCCTFDSSDAWELPVIDGQLAQTSALQHCRFDVKNSVCKFAPQYNSEGLFACPMLTENGCRLGDNKPFDCRLWPLRVMTAGNYYLLTLSPNCPATSQHSLTTIIEFIEKHNIAQIAFDNAQQHSQALHHYIDGYPVFAIKKITNKEL
ncbi:MAG: hypothetical protein LBV75_06915 [Paludibacter sp.]|jgi:Fe-S-cluster containining protein|nr:hypothetical protein [Paludibacter sp.]